MACIINQIPFLSTIPAPNNPHNLPHNLTVWEIMLNQKFSKEYLEDEKQRRGDYEGFVQYLLQSLYEANAIYISSPVTGEVLYWYDTRTGAEYRVEEAFV